MVTVAEVLDGLLEEGFQWDEAYRVGDVPFGATLSRELILHVKIPRKKA